MMPYYLKGFSSALETLFRNVGYVFLTIKTTGCTIFSNLFWNEILHASDSSSIHHQEFFNVRSATFMS